MRSKWFSFQEEFGQLLSGAEASRDDVRDGRTRT